MSENEVKAEAMKDFDNFLIQFNAWEPSDKPEPSDKDPIREQYINLRGAGFASWVHKNLDYIRGLGGVHEEEIKTKWRKLYPGEPYPLDKAEDAATGQDEIQSLHRGEATIALLHLLQVQHLAPMFRGPIQILFLS